MKYDDDIYICMKFFQNNASFQTYALLYFNNIFYKCMHILLRKRFEIIINYNLTNKSLKFNHFK